MSERCESYWDKNVTVDVNNCSNETLNDHSWPYPLWQSILIIILLSIMIIGTIIGNVLVCLAVCLVRKLRHPSNYLIVSLAISDMCVAVLVMPFALLYDILGKWVLGPKLCDLWVAFDVMMCTASILNLCMISVDRYFAITKPLQYAMKRTPKRMLFSIAIVWIAAALISIPPLLYLGNDNTNNNCLVSQHQGYQIYATLFAFYLPLTVMVIVYYKIYVAAKRITDAEKKAQRHNSIFRAESIKPKPEDNNSRSNGILPKERNKKVNFTDNSKISEWIIKRLPQRRQQLSPAKKVESTITKERKASKTLGVIMGAFIFCWLPFFIAALVRSFCKPDCNIPDWLSSVFLWLGYTNSLLNPIIYARFNKDFRKPFKEIICFRCRDLQEILRSETYSSQYGSPAITRQLIRADTVIRYDSVSSTANVDLPNKTTAEAGESHL